MAKRFSRINRLLLHHFHSRGQEGILAELPGLAGFAGEVFDDHSAAGLIGELGLVGVDCFGLDAAVVVVPEECQSKPMTHENAWNQ